MIEGLGPALKLAPALGPWIGVALVVGYVLQRWQPFRQMQLAREKDLTAMLTERVATLERLREEDSTKWEKERERLENKIESQRQLYEARMETERLRHEADFGKMRHRANNADTCLDSFVMLLEAEDTLSTKAQRALTSIKEMRDRQRAEQAAESRAVMQAKLASVGSPLPTLP